MIYEIEKEGDINLIGLYNELVSCSFADKLDKDCRCLKKGTKVVIKTTSDLTPQEILEAETMVDNHDGSGFNQRDRVKDQYAKNKSFGDDLIMDMTTDINIKIFTQEITVEQGETYGFNTKTAIDELHIGYVHSGYNFLKGYTPITELSDLHNEVLNRVKTYINTNYHPYFHVT